MLLLALMVVVLLWPWLTHLGGAGLVLLGIADNSVVPLTGSMDVFTIWLAASRREFWPLYAFLATLGAVLGGYITYSLGREGGKEAIERKLHKQKAAKLFQKFEKYGFRTVVITSMLPPPFPLVPVLLTAGALQYPRRKFVGALSLGRGIRYMIVAGLGALYGDQIVGFFSRYYKIAILILIGLAVVGGIFTFIEYRRSKHHHKHDEPVSRAA